MRVLVQSQPFEVDRHYDFLVRENPGAAVVTFTGYVRDHCDRGDVTALELEHYPGMTERVLEEIGAKAQQRFGLEAWSIIHRYGKLEVTDPIVWVGVVANHRGAAFDACQFIMDVLKTDAPFWKREHLDDGSATWVEARGEDAERRLHWGHEGEQ